MTPTQRAHRAAVLLVAAHDLDPVEPAGSPASTEGYADVLRSMAASVLAGSICAGDADDFTTLAGRASA